MPNNHWPLHVYPVLKDHEKSLRTSYKHSRTSPEIESNEMNEKVEIYASNQFINWQLKRQTVPKLEELKQTKQNKIIAITLEFLP